MQSKSSQQEVITPDVQKPVPFVVADYLGKLVEQMDKKHLLAAIESGDKIVGKIEDSKIRRSLKEFKTTVRQHTNLANALIGAVL